jgi:xanthine dehydrogenase accessory factor
MTEHPIDELGKTVASLQSWLKAGHRCAIATVIRAWGSSPRRPGSMMAVRDDGLFEGSVSGGCVEADVVVRARMLIPDEGFELVEYGVEDARAWEVGLACGGRITILIQTISEPFFSAELLDWLANERTTHRGVHISTDLETGLSRSGASTSESHISYFYPPPLRLAIVGAVHIAQALAPMARLAGYETIIIDPRNSFAAAERFKGEVVDTRWPDEALVEWKPDSGSAVVMLTHDPKLDDPALDLALKSDAFYIAALGSRATHAKRVERLRAMGYDDVAITRVHGPAGLAIGSVTAPEIAISILAQMTQRLHGK